MRYATLDDVRYFSREIKRRCADRKVGLVFKTGLPTAHATKTSIVVPTPTFPMEYEEFVMLRYYALHEVGHHLRAECFDLLDQVAPILTDNMFGVWNCVEDELQENEIRRVWAGDLRTLRMGRDIHITRMNKAMRKDKDSGLPFCPDGVKKAVVHAVCQMARIKWHPNIAALVDVTLDILGTDARALFDELMAEGWADRIKPMSVADGYTLARELHARVWPHEEEKDPEAQQNEAGEDEENQEDSKGESESCNNSESGDDEEGESVPKNISIDWKDLVNDDHADKLDDGDPDPDGEYEINYTGWTPQTGEYYPRDQVIVKHPSHEDELPRWCEYEDYDPDTSVANQIRRYIQSKNRAAWQTNRLSGRINKRALKRIRTGTREFNRKIFQKRTDTEAMDTAIMLLVDWSGSMSGERSYIAAGAAATLSDCFERILGVPVCVLGHTDGLRLEMIHAKDFGERRTGAEIYRSLFSVEMCGNADGDALLYAYDIMRKRPESRKIIISISDGNPADSFSGCPATLLKQAIDMIRTTDVELYGVGAQHRNVHLFYGDDSVVIDNLDELNECILNIAKGFVLK
jgi:hypothetical protein